MYILLGIVLILWGLVMLCVPNFVYELTESWKSNRSAEPSDFYRFSTRFGGVMFILVGIGGMFMPFMG